MTKEENEIIAVTKRQFLETCGDVVGKLVADMIKEDRHKADEAMMMGLSLSAFSVEIARKLFDEEDEA